VSHRLPWDKRGSVKYDQMPDTSPETLKGLSDHDLFRLVADHKPASAAHLAGQSENQASRKRDGSHGRGIGILSVAVAIVAVIVSAYTSSYTRETLFQSQRAWVNVQKIEAISSPNFDNGYFDFWLRITMTNSGSGVARDIWMGAVVLKAKTGSGYDPYLEANWDRAKGEVEKAIKGAKERWPIGYVLAPKQQTEILFPGVSHEVTPELAKAGKYVVNGYISYLDQFNQSHSTRFSFRPDVREGVFSVDEPPTFVPDGRFSTAD